jgi:tetratricopeptide (TPR) repeat protein
MSARRRFWWRIVLLLAVLAAGALIARPQMLGWYHWWQGRSELARYHPAKASAHFEQCLRVWPEDAEVHLLASRAARQNGDLELANEHLHVSQQAQHGKSKEVALEWAMLHAAGGDLNDFEEFLQRQAREDPVHAPLIWEAVASGYIRLNRPVDALACVELWLEVEANNIRALELRGQAYQTGRQTRKAIDDFRHVLELDPSRDDARFRLVLNLLDTGAYDEAVPLLEQLDRQRPDDPEVKFRMARCLFMLDKQDAAKQILDAVIEAHPEHARSLTTRAQFAIADDQPDKAEAWLRRAIAASPDDYQAQFLLHRALEQQHKPEAAAQLLIANEAKERAERLSDLRNRKMFDQPLDPALHYEMGVLLVRGGHEKTGEGWLLSALKLKPDYPQAHAALADLYEHQGDHERAAEHRRQSGQQQK